MTDAAPRRPTVRWDDVQDRLREDGCLITEFGQVATDDVDLGQTYQVIAVSRSDGHVVGVQVQAITIDGMVWPPPPDPESDGG